MCDARLSHKDYQYHTGPFERGTQVEICAPLIWNCCWGEPGASPGRIHIKVCIYPGTPKERVVYERITWTFNPGDTYRFPIRITIPEDVDTPELPLGIKVWCENIEAEPSW